MGARAKREEAIKTRTSKREPKEVKVIKPKGRSQVHSMQMRSFNSRGYDSDDDGSMQESDDELEDEVSSDLSGAESADQPIPFLGPQVDAFEAFLKVYAMAQGKESAGKSSMNREVSKPCTHCGSTQHRDLNCWRRLTCSACGRQGHPETHCFQRCKGCGQVHERGECSLEEFMAQMKAWYDPAKHAGLLPSTVEKTLN